MCRAIAYVYLYEKINATPHFKIDFNNKNTCTKYDEYFGLVLKTVAFILITLHYQLSARDNKIFVPKCFQPYFYTYILVRVLKMKNYFEFTAFLNYGLLEQ